MFKPYRARSTKAIKCIYKHRGAVVHQFITLKISHRHFSAEFIRLKFFAPVTQDRLSPRRVKRLHLEFPTAPGRPPAPTPFCTAVQTVACGGVRPSVSAASQPSTARGGSTSLLPSPSPWPAHFRICVRIGL